MTSNQKRRTKVETEKISYTRQDRKICRSIGRHSEAYKVEINTTNG